MQKEVGVSRAREKITAWVATNDEMACGMDAQVVRRGKEVALHVRLEPVDVAETGDERGDVGVGEKARGYVLRDVAAETARVVAEAGHERVLWGVVERGGDWAKVDGPTEGG